MDVPCDRPGTQIQASSVGTQQALLGETGEAGTLPEEGLSPRPLDDPMEDLFCYEVFPYIFNKDLGKVRG